MHMHMHMHIHAHAHTCTCSTHTVPSASHTVAGIDFIGIDEKRQRLLHVESAADCDAGVSSISQSLLQTYPHLQVSTDSSKSAPRRKWVLLTADPHDTDFYYLTLPGLT